MIRLEHRPRLPRLPTLPAALAILWILLFIAGVILFSFTGGPLCHIRMTTGFPCATCGGTRAVLSVANGDFLKAVHYNPLVILSLVSAGALLAIRLGIGLQPVLELRRRGWTTVAILVALLFALNWSYVISSQG